VVYDCSSLGAERIELRQPPHTYKQETEDAVCILGGAVVSRLARSVKRSDKGNPGIPHVLYS
jgi:hypothetical protein